MDSTQPTTILETLSKNLEGACKRWKQSNRPSSPRFDIERDEITGNYSVRFRFSYEGHPDANPSEDIHLGTAPLHTLGEFTQKMLKMHVPKDLQGKVKTAGTYRFFGYDLSWALTDFDVQRGQQHSEPIARPHAIPAGIRMAYPVARFFGDIQAMLLEETRRAATEIAADQMEAERRSTTPNLDSVRRCRDFLARFTR